MAQQRTQMYPEVYLDGGEVGVLGWCGRRGIPPFLWVAKGTGAESLPTTVNGDYHNPYIKPSAVKQLIALGQR